MASSMAFASRSPVSARVRSWATCCLPMTQNLSVVDNWVPIGAEPYNAHSGTLKREIPREYPGEGSVISVLEDSQVAHLLSGPPGGQQVGSPRTSEMVSAGISQVVLPRRQVGRIALVRAGLLAATLLACALAGAVLWGWRWRPRPRIDYIQLNGERLHALCAATVGSVRNLTDLDTDEFQERSQLVSDGGRCREYIKRMPELGECPVLAHTALWRPPDRGEADFALMIRKARILALSFLASQRSEAQLWYWVQSSGDVASMTAALRLEGLEGAERVVVLAFDTLAGELQGHDAQSVNITSIAAVNSERLPAVLDVARYLLLYQYGGLWIDADVMVLRDLSPLQGLDFAYVLQNHLYKHSEVANNAILGVQCPHSPFMKAVLAKIVESIDESLSDKNVYKWGPSLLMSLPPGTFHSMPTCFFEPAGLGMGGHFFSREHNTTKMVNDILDAAGSHDADPRAFAYHWHNRWRMRIHPESAFALESQRLSELLESRLMRVQQHAEMVEEP